MHPNPRLRRLAHLCHLISNKTHEQTRYQYLGWMREPLDWARTGAPGSGSLERELGETICLGSGFFLASSWIWMGVLAFVCCLYNKLKVPPPPPTIFIIPLGGGGGLCFVPEILTCLDPRSRVLALLLGCVNELHGWCSLHSISLPSMEWKTMLVASYQLPSSNRWKSMKRIEKRRDEMRSQWID